MQSIMSFEQFSSGKKLDENFMSGHDDASVGGLSGGAGNHEEVAAMEDAIKRIYHKVKGFFTGKSKEEIDAKTEEILGSLGEQEVTEEPVDGSEGPAGMPGGPDMPVA